MSPRPHPSHAHVIALYERHAAEWASCRSASPQLERQWLERFENAMMQPGHVLDLGCGTGQPIARWLVDQGHRVTGVDSSEAMLALCRQRLPEQTWLHGDMRNLALPGVFDGVVAWDSFFHLCPFDQRRMFSVFASHAAPGSPLLFTSGPAAGEAIGQFGGEELYHASLAPEEYRMLLQQHGFAVLEYVPEDRECGGHTVWLARKVVLR